MQVQAEPMQIEASTTQIAIVAVPTIEARIEAYSLSQGVSPKLAIYIASHESGFDADQIGDMYITCRRTGKPVRARGLYQITECFHPEISDAQAFDPDFSMKWAVKVMLDKKYCMMQFSTCRDYYKL